MSRGPGALQRFILTELERRRDLARALHGAAWSGYAWATAEDLAALWVRGWPDHADRVNVRRALHALERAGRVELAEWRPDYDPHAPPGSRSWRRPIRRMLAARLPLPPNDAARERRRRAADDAPRRAFLASLSGRRRSPY